MSKKIYLSPSSQPDNAYAYGNTNEQEQCRRISAACAKALERCGFEVKDGNSGTMYTRVSESDAWGADLHVPIHTNAYDGSVSGTRIFCFNTTGEGYKAANAVFNELAPVTPGTSESVRADASLYEIKEAYAPTVYIEVEFHDVAASAKWIVENVEIIGEAIAKGICNHYGVSYVEPVVSIPKYSLVLGEYDTIKEADDVLGDIHYAINLLQNIADKIVIDEKDG